MNPFKKAAHMVSWLLLGIINFALLLVGIPLIAIFAGLPQEDWPRWTWLWQNEEDQGAPRWYETRFPDGSPWLRIRLGENMGGYDPDTLFVFARHNKWVRQWKYSAFRNPVNNHRFLFEDRTDFQVSGDPEAFIHSGRSLEASGERVSKGWRWSGPFAGYKKTWLKGPGFYSEFYIGWKVGSGVPGLGFTLQLRFNRPFIPEEY